jgi:uncharacterized protein HemX
MLAAILMAFFLGGAGGVFGGILTQSILEDAEGRMQQTIDDPARAEQAATLVKELSSEIKRFDKTFGKSGKALTKIYKNHAAEEGALQAQLDALNTDWEAAQGRALDLRFDVKEVMTREEWERTFTERQIE